jgi:hypothetical protein
VPARPEAGAPDSGAGLAVDPSTLQAAALLPSDASSEKSQADAQAPEAAAATTTAAPPEALPEAPTRDVLIWRRSDDGEHTAWLRLKPLATPELLAERSGLWLAAGDEIWQLHLRTRRVAACSPARCRRDFTVCKKLAPKRSAALVTDAAWRGLARGQRVEVGVPPPAQVAVKLVATEFATDWVPLAGLDDRLVLRQDWRLRPCGADQARTTRQAVLVRVGQGGLLPLASSAQADAMLAADGASLDVGLGGGPTQPAPRWFAVRQRLSPEGAWLREHVVVARGDDGEQSTEVAAVALPTALADAAQDAPDLRALAAELRDAWSHAQQAAGWSWVVGEPSRRGDLLARFRLP